MRMLLVEEIKSIDAGNKENDKCPYGMNTAEEGFIYCQTSQCMAWYWTGDNQGCCALVYRPETIDIMSKIKKDQSLNDLITEILDISTESREDGSMYLNTDARNIADEIIKAL